MYLLLRLKPSPLKQLYPSLSAPFSTSARLSVEKKIYHEKASNENKKRKDHKAVLTAKERRLANQIKQAKNDAKLMRQLAANLPKKGTTPYNLFVKESYTRKTNATGESATGVVRALAQEWSSLSESQKQTYKEKYVEWVKQYEVDFKKWANTLSADERVLFGTKGQKYLTKAQRAELWTPPVTPYRAFINAELASVDWKGLDRDDFRKTFANTVKEASQKWNALSQEQRQKYSSVN